MNMVECYYQHKGPILTRRLSQAPPFHLKDNISQDQTFRVVIRPCLNNINATATEDVDAARIMSYIQATAPDDNATAPNALLGIIL